MAFEEFEALTIDQLRARGSSKWTTFPDAIGTFVAESDFGTAPAVVRTIEEQVGNLSFGYSTETQKGEAVQALADWLADRFAWHIEPDQVGLVPEVLTSLELMLDNFLDPGAPVVLPTPNYMPFFNLIPDHGHPVIEVPLRQVTATGAVVAAGTAASAGTGQSGNTWTFDYEAIDAAFDQGAQMLVLVNPANPTGTVYTREQLEPLVDIVDRHGARVWADEVHAPLIYDGRQHVPYATLSPPAAAHTVTTTSPSKGWNVAGLKCAQMIFSNPEDAKRFATVGKWAAHATGYLGVLATTAAYNGGRDWLDSLVTHLQDRRDQLTRLVAEQLPDAGIIPAQGTYLGWLDLGAYPVDGDRQTFLRRHAHVAGTDGRLCGRVAQDYFRINFATPAAVLDETIERIATALQA